MQDSPNLAYGSGARRTAPVQAGGATLTLTLPFVVDASKTVRVYLWQENFNGSSTWTAPVFTDISPAPDNTLQASNSTSPSLQLNHSTVGIQSDLYQDYNLTSFHVG